MKKVILVIVMAMFMSMGFAQVKFNRPVIDFSRGYELKIDVRRLSDKLQLDEVQAEYVQVINDCMVSELDAAVNSNGRDRVMKVRRAIDKDIRNMRSILNEEQFRTYVMLLFTTIRNNFINNGLNE